MAGLLIALFGTLILVRTLSTVLQQVVGTVLIILGVLMLAGIVNFNV